MKTDFLRSYEEVRFILHLLNYEHFSKNSVIKIGLPQISTADRFSVPKKKTLSLNLHKNWLKSAVFKMFHWNILKGKFAENC